jgi:hypothetical protein
MEETLRRQRNIWEGNIKSNVTESWYDDNCALFKHHVLYQTQPENPYNHVSVQTQSVPKFKQNKMDMCGPQRLRYYPDNCLRDEEIIKISVRMA